MVSIDSKKGELKEFSKPSSNFKNHKPLTNETKSHKYRILNNFTYKKSDTFHFDTYKKNYDNEDLNETDHFFFLTLTSLKYLVTKNKTQSRLRESQKPLWFEINKKEFEEFTGDIYNNQDNNDFKTIINNRTYDLKNAKKIQWKELHEK